MNLVNRQVRPELFLTNLENCIGGGVQSLHISRTEKAYRGQEWITASLVWVYATVGRAELWRVSRLKLVQF